MRRDMRKWTCAHDLRPTQLRGALSSSQLLILFARMAKLYTTRVMAALMVMFSGAGAFVSPFKAFDVTPHVSGGMTGTASSRKVLVGRSYRTHMTASDNTLKKAVFGGGCFWCIEAVYQKLDGVQKVVSGYAGGTLENPTYRDVCSGRSGHAEVVLVEYDPTVVTYDELLELFWKSHDPTQGNRQGLDVGTEYRSVILCEDEEQLKAALASKEAQQAKLNKEAVLGKVVGAVMGKNEDENVVDITTCIDLLPVFWEAEKVHQNYYAKNPLSPYCIMNVGTKLVKLRPDISRINRLTREREQAL